MQRTDLGDIHCSVARTVNIVGEWWTPLILRDLFAGIDTFDDLRRDLGVSTNILTDRLNRLVEHGIVERHPYGSHPNRFRYRLTDKGSELIPVVLAVMAWGDKWESATDGPPAVVVHTDCGHAMHAVPHCSECGEALHNEALELRAGPGGRIAPGTEVLGRRLSE